MKRYCRKFDRFKRVIVDTETYKTIFFTYMSGWEQLISLETFFTATFGRCSIEKLHRYE